MNILVRSPNWIGDQILAFPFYFYLRQSYPKAHICVSCVDWVKDTQFIDLVNEVVVLPRPQSDSFLDRFKTLDQGALQLKALNRWDLGFALPNSFSAGWLLYRAGALNRRGYNVDGRGLLLTDKIFWDSSPTRHRAQAYMDILPENIRPRRPVSDFWGILPENELDPKIPGELEKFDPNISWPDAVPVDPPSGPYWVMAPGAVADSRRWPLEKYAELAQKIWKDTSLKCVVVGGPKEAPLVERLRELSSAEILDYTARGPVTVLWKIFSGSRFTVCNESGLAHVAALCGSFVQIVCGAADPRRTRPLGPGKVQVWMNPVECWPCEKNVCGQRGDKVLVCLRAIGAAQVWEEIKNGIN